jgi:serine/threonine-protein kinase SRPK3
MLGVDYDSSADMWSLACMVFELVTADFLFEPRKGQSSGYGKSDDHLAQIMELLGPMPKSFAFAGKQFNKFFTYDDLSKKFTF